MVNVDSGPHYTGSPIDPKEALRLLTQQSVGRVAFTDRALPAISAVTYSLVGSSVVIHCAVDGLGRQLDGQVVAFEIDDLDPASGAGWTVVLTGTARLLPQPGDLVRLPPLQRSPDQAAERYDVVVIEPRVVTGRWVG